MNFQNDVARMLYAVSNVEMPEDSKELPNVPPTSQAPQVSQTQQMQTVQKDSNESAREHLHKAINRDRYLRRWKR